MEMMLQTQNLCKYFRKQKAVNNVSLNIEKGQIYGLLGPKGALFMRFFRFVYISMYRMALVNLPH